ncbi:Methylated-DNA--protein-cysteine methyltransferase [Vibrio palustris]|uniref:Methylated-DNA--protein-cysteine methyltransferase n=2 Tax=Vibrio palustris TaxID=1918946 RepID=A0A1R4B3D1_9VIBR|nr:Methylated-DNA--protein-cysteine methyltransferase [Vibrio palustris]
MNSMDQFLAQIFLVIARIPQSSISTYGDIARMAGYPGYARHVGKALKQLPQDSKLPWYRVINSQGKISLTGDDFSRQRAQLLEDGIEVSASGRISLRTYRWDPGKSEQ